jgi:hypothetical protein
MEKTRKIQQEQQADIQRLEQLIRSQQATYPHALQKQPRVRKKTKRFYTTNNHSTPINILILENASAKNNISAIMAHSHHSDDNNLGQDFFSATQNPTTVAKRQI